MALLNRSSLTFANAQLEVAGAAGAGSTETEMLTRAGNSLDAMAQRWNRLRWKFLQTDQIIGLVQPFTVTGCTTTAGSATVTTTDTFTSVLVDDVANGGGLRPDQMVSTTGTTAIVMYASASASVTGSTLTFKRELYPVNSDFKQIFDVRIMGAPRILYYQPRRLYDREVIDQSSTNVLPFGYDLYDIETKGKIRILGPPGGPETVILKYYRRMVMPSQTASLGLDLPEDYEDVFIAASKAHFLADKGQPHREQWLYWKSYAEDGLKQMRSDERIVEDEDLSLQPPIPQRIYGPNSPYYWYAGGI